MAYNFTSYVIQIAQLIPTSVTDTNYINIWSPMIDYAEQRCYRELNLLSTVVTDASGTLSAGSRNFTLPQASGRFVVVNGINVFTPSGSQTTRNQLMPISRDFIDSVWPANTTADVPAYFAMITDQTIILGPPPDAGYSVEVVGTIRPTALGPSNLTTFLTVYLPDLFLAATMVWVSGWMKNFGAQGDNPQMAQSWENQYQTLFKSAKQEELRKMFAGSAWSSQEISPVAAPPRN